MLGLLLGPGALQPRPGPCRLDAPRLGERRVPLLGGAFRPDALGFRGAGRQGGRGGTPLGIVAGKPRAPLTEHRLRRRARGGVLQPEHPGEQLRREAAAREGHPRERLAQHLEVLGRQELREHGAHARRADLEGVGGRHVSARLEPGEREPRGPGHGAHPSGEQQPLLHGYGLECTQGLGLHSTRGSGLRRAGGAQRGASRQRVELIHGAAA